MNETIFTARLAKRAKVMFSQACVTHSWNRGERGRVIPNASWDRSHGHRRRWSVPLGWRSWWGGGGPGEGWRSWSGVVDVLVRGVEVLVRGEGMSTPPPGHPPNNTPTPRHPPSLHRKAKNQEIRWMSGRYASYWNAFLFSSWSSTEVKRRCACCGINFENWLQMIFSWDHIKIAFKSV